LSSNFLVTGQIADQIATHNASDIVVSTMGRGSFLFGGVMENTDVFFKVMRVALGDTNLKQDIKNLWKREDRAVPAEQCDDSDDH
jgi:hypothetical protein